MKSFQDFLQEAETKQIKSDAEKTTTDRVKSRQDQEKETLKSKHEKEMEDARRKDFEDKENQRKRKEQEMAAKRRAETSIKETMDTYVPKPVENIMTKQGEILLHVLVKDFDKNPDSSTFKVLKKFVPYAKAMKKLVNVARTAKYNADYYSIKVTYTF